MVSMTFIQRSIYEVTISIVVLYGTLVELVESMKINHEDEYARLGHMEFEEDEIGDFHESKYLYPFLDPYRTGGTIGPFG